MKRNSRSKKHPSKALKLSKRKNSRVKKTSLKSSIRRADKKKTNTRKQLTKLRRSTQSGALWIEHRSFRVFSYAVITIFIATVGLFYAVLFSNLPNPATLRTVETPHTTIIRDRNGTVLYRVYKDANRVHLTWDEIPESVKMATIAIEDTDFYYHIGIAPKAILRAFLHNLNQDDVNAYQGASTITQQLVKNRLLSHERTYSRKIKEVVLAVWTELTYSKQEILTMYLNEVGYGGPAYGIEAASQMYFEKPASQLTLAEAAFLAGLPAAPTSFSPFGSNPELADIRQSEVLNRMFTLGMISKTQYDQAKGQKLAFASPTTDIQAPHFVMFVKDALVQKFGEQMVTEGGLDVTTTLDLNVQNKAQDIVQKQIGEIGSKYNIHNAASLVTKPGTGEILAMVGSPDYFDLKNKGYVNATTAFRQPGSSIKPVNYAYLLDHGYTPNSTIEDAPVAFKSATETYIPKNYDGKYHGMVTLRAALANSYNIPAVKWLNSYGVDKMVMQGKAMGIKSWNNIPQVGLSLTLGGAEVTMLDMARAFGTIANLGKEKELVFIKSIKKISDNTELTSAFFEEKADDGSIIKTAEAKDTKQAVSPMAAYWLTDILADNNARMPAFGPYAKLTVPGHKVAVKTGTSNDFRDNWTIGYTPDYLVATWVGNSDGSYMNQNLVSGITGAAPIWNETMTTLLADKPDKDFPKPAGMIPVKICAVNGLLTCANCPSERIEYFTPEKVPTQRCSFRAPTDCTEAAKQLDGKSDDEKKTLMTGCYMAPTPATTKN